MVITSVGASSDSLTIFVFVVGILITIIGALLSLLLGYLWQTIGGLRNDIQQNTKHIESVNHNYYGMMWRVRDIERDLKEQHDYRPLPVQERDTEEND